MGDLAKMLRLTEHETFSNMSAIFRAELIMQAFKRMRGEVEDLICQWENVVCEASPPDAERTKKLVDLLGQVIPDTIEKGVKKAVAEFWKKRKRESIDRNKRNPNRYLTVDTGHFLKALRDDVVEHEKEWMGQKDFEDRITFVRKRALEVEERALDVEADELARVVR
jgi:hypothetical protein